jgi:hypothetical protein
MNNAGPFAPLASPAPLALPFAAEAQRIAGELTDKEKKAVLLLSSRPMRAKQFARLFWPDSECWQNHTNCGRGVTRGGGMVIAAGGYLGKLKRKHPRIFRWLSLNETGYALSDIGLEVQELLESQS